MSLFFFQMPQALSELPAFWLNWLSQLAGNSEGLVGFGNNFNGIYFHHHFYVKTGVKSP